MKPLLLALAVFLTGCQQLPQEGAASDPAELTSKDIEYIQSISQSWADAVLGGCDSDELFSLYTEDSIRLVGPEPLIGKEAMRQHEASQRCEISDFRITNREVSGSGDIAYVWDDFMMRSSVDSNWVVEGSWLGIVRKQGDGTWKIVMDMVKESNPASEM